MRFLKWLVLKITSSQIALFKFWLRGQLTALVGQCVQDGMGYHEIIACVKEDCDSIIFETPISKNRIKCKATEFGIWTELVRRSERWSHCFPIAVFWVTLSGIFRDVFTEVIGKKVMTFHSVNIPATPAAGFGKSALSDILIRAS